MTGMTVPKQIDVLIITDEDGTTDWQVSPEHRERVRLVHVDYRCVDSWFLDDIEQAARDVQAMTRSLPWREQVLARLKLKHASMKEKLYGFEVEED
jgi:hypothetical protein